MSHGPPETPRLTVDAIIEISPNSPAGGPAGLHDGVSGIVLVRRKYTPLGWALPGGFVDIGETVATAARREALEETSLEVEITELLGVYSDPKRDPRGFHTVGMVFIARASGQPKGGDDAAEARIFPLDALPSDIPFDHPLIIEDYRRYRRGLGRPPVGR
jgi:8-oxo-dGTP diphosphatase